MSDFDNWLYMQADKQYDESNQEPELICDECGEPIYEYDLYLDLPNGMRVHVDCINPEHVDEEYLAEDVLEECRRIA